MANCSKCGFANRDGVVVCIKCAHEVTAPYKAASTTSLSRKWKPVLAVAAGLLLIAVVASAIVVSSASNGTTPGTTGSRASPISSAARTVVPVPPTTANASEAVYAFSQVVQQFRVVAKQGIAPHYVFRYTTGEGGVAVCDLPSSMAKGKQTISTWIATFDAYSVSERVASVPIRSPEPRADLSDAPWRQGGGSPPSAGSQARIAGVPDEYLRRIANIERREIASASGMRPPSRVERVPNEAGLVAAIVASMTPDPGLSPPGANDWRFGSVSYNAGLAHGQLINRYGAPYPFMAQYMGGTWQVIEGTTGVGAMAVSPFDR